LPSRSAKAFASIGVDAAPHAWDGDTHPDLVYRNSASGATYIWHMNGLALDHDQYVTTIDPFVEPRRPRRLRRRRQERHGVARTKPPARRTSGT
jgi:hypothetical protein